MNVKPHEKTRKVRLMGMAGPLWKRYAGLRGHVGGERVR
jgi:hypothetical protein